MTPEMIDDIAILALHVTESFEESGAPTTFKDYDTLFNAMLQHICVHFPTVSSQLPTVPDHGRNVIVRWFVDMLLEVIFTAGVVQIIAYEPSQATAKDTDFA